MITHGMTLAKAVYIVSHIENHIEEQPALSYAALKKLVKYETVPKDSLQRVREEIEWILSECRKEETLNVNRGSS